MEKQLLRWSQIKYQSWSEINLIGRQMCMEKLDLSQCFSTFLLPQNPTQAWRSLTEPHALICESSDVWENEATGCLQTHFLSWALRAEPSWGRQSRLIWLIWNLTTLVCSSMLLYSKHDRRGAVVDGRLAPPPTQKIYHVDAFRKDRPTSLFNFF